MAVVKGVPKVKVAPTPTLIPAITKTTTVKHGNKSSCGIKGF
jgi:hypothetical protein